VNPQRELKLVKLGKPDTAPSSVVDLAFDLICVYLRLSAAQILQRISAPRASVSSDFAKQNRSTRCGGGSR
jgi:hypothetical protein